MATRLPYYTGEDDIYSRLMAQFANEIQPAPGGMGTFAPGMAGGYNPGLYDTPAAAQALGGISSGSGLLYDYGIGAASPGDGNTAWSNLTPSQQAAYYAANPTMGKVTQLGQGLFGMTALGQLQKGLFPNFVQQQQMIAQGIDPFGMAALSPQEQSNVNQALSAYLESSMNQFNEATTPSASMGNDVMGFGAYGENVAPAGVEVGGPIASPGIVATDLGLLDAGAVAPSSDFGSAGETAPGGASFGSDIGFDSGGGGGGDGGGGGGSKMICTKLYHLGKMPEDIFVADQAFGALMAKQHPETYAGYALWARHVVRWMSREDWIGKAVVGIVHTIATPWSVAMAEEMGVNVKSGWFGRFLMKRGLQMCKLIGEINKTRSLQNV